MYNMTIYDINSFYGWIADGNACKGEDGRWLEQTTQWRTAFTWIELKEFFIKEYLLAELSGQELEELGY